MITFFQLSFVILFILFLVFLVIYGKQKKFKDTRDLVWKSIIDAMTLNSGIIVLLYVVGKVFIWEYLTEIDNYALYIALIIAGLVIIADAIDKIKSKKEVSK
ncbi:hypothetical protein HOC32_05625 [Candidatus Woesearchaeota archaeon]|jgi:hypothetical protein|nr:hypothetical protein [Candidatus Woesearchaeota archaeon]